MAVVRCLSTHRDYGCRDAGVCCSSDWPIPLERDGVAAIEAALTSGRLRGAAGLDPLERPAHAPAATPVVFARTGGRCVFHRGSRGPGCAIHSALGASAMPLACRQFPRVSLIDPRGVSVTLSHYCPTAASMLRRDERTTIECDAPAFPAGGEYIGLDVRDRLPPLVSPTVLMDWDSWWRLEALAVDTLANGREPIHARLVRLRRAVAHVAAWRPDDGALATRVEAAFREPGTAPRPPRDRDDLIRAALDRIPIDLRSQTPPPATSELSEVDDGAIGRFLAAHAFANWTAHLGQGLDDWLDSIETAAAFVNAGYSIGGVDLVLRHLLE